MLEMTAMYDTIVVGAGIEGSATAYYLAKQEQKTLLLEQVNLILFMDINITNLVFYLTRLYYLKHFALVYLNYTGHFMTTLIT